MQGRVALVTGAGSGIGRASARAFGRAGAHVVCADMNRDSAEETAELVTSANVAATATAAYVDVTCARSVHDLIASAIETHGHLDFAHNNAGVAAPRSVIAETPEDEFDRVVATNLKGVFLCLRAELEVMSRQGSGAIVNTASTFGLVGRAESGVYAAAKHGVVGLTKSSALECAASGIRINAICPGPIATAMVSGAEMHSALSAEVPIGRMGTPNEVAEAALWLCSDGASYVTGSCLVVDGGWTAR